MYDPLNTSINVKAVYITNLENKCTVYCAYIAFDYGSFSCHLYRYTYMSEMAFGALLFGTNLMNTPPEEGMKPLVGILFVC